MTRVNLSPVTSGEPIEAATTNGLINNDQDHEMWIQAHPALALNVKAFGAAGDGIADDTAPVGYALSAWMAKLNSSQPCDLVFPPGVYRISHGYVLTPKSGIIGGSIQGPGARLKQDESGSDPYLITVSTLNSKFDWQRLNLTGLHLDGGGIYLLAGSTTEAIYNVGIDKVHVTNAPVCALRMTGVFESQVTDSFFELDPKMTPIDDSHCAILIDRKPGGVQPSSINICNVSTRGGFRGIRSPNSADVRLTNVTVLAAQREGIFLTGAGQTLVGIHAEDNWLTSESNAGGAAVRIDGSADLLGIMCVANTGRSQRPYSGSTTQKYGVRTFVFSSDNVGKVGPGHVSVSGVTMVSNVPGSVQVQCTGGASGSVLVIIGVTSSIIEEIPDGNVITGL